MPNQYSKNLNTFAGEYKTKAKDESDVKYLLRKFREIVFHPITTFLGERDDKNGLIVQNLIALCTDKVIMEVQSLSEKMNKNISDVKR